LKIHPAHAHAHTHAQDGNTRSGEHMLGTRSIPAHTHACTYTAHIRRNSPKPCGTRDLPCPYEQKRTLCDKFMTDSKIALTRVTDFDILEATQAGNGSVIDPVPTRTNPWGSAINGA